MRKGSSGAQTRKVLTKSIISPNLASTSSAPASHSSVEAFDQRSLPCSYSSTYRLRSASENCRPGISPNAAVGCGMCGGRVNAGARSFGAISSMEDVRDREARERDGLRRTQGRFVGSESRGRLDCCMARVASRSWSLQGEAGRPRFVECAKRVSRLTSVRFTGAKRSLGASASACSEK